MNDLGKVAEKIALDPNDAVFLIVQLCIKQLPSPVIKTIVVQPMALSLQSSVFKFIVIVHSYWQSHQLYCWNIRNRNTSFVHTNVAVVDKLKRKTNKQTVCPYCLTVLPWWGGHYILCETWKGNIFLKSQGFNRHCVFLSNKVKLPHTPSKS